ncbi:MAG: hypothetical protein II592_00350 [Muribaculaceae bacterium]|jgi:hypothetical protein|nr:hypothetical protein [Muribaculaceae bacterium]MBQ4137982.1 hypothetical protein [Muribaculaceae bacterium]
MKIKTLVCALAGAMCLMSAPGMKAAVAPATEHLYASVDGFNKMKSCLNATLEGLKNAQNAKQVSNAMYNYVKTSLPVNKYYSDLTDYQKKQIDALQKQVGILSQKKTAQFNCKKEVEQAVQKATLEAIASMK